MLTFRRSKFTLLVLYVFVVIGGSIWFWQSSQNRQLANHQEQLERFAEYISSKLDKYVHLPQLIAKNPALVAALQSTDAYLLDEYDNTIASSNDNWLFKSLTPLSEQDRLAILNSRQYLDQPIRSMNLIGDISQEHAELKNPTSSGEISGWLADICFMPLCQNAKP